MKTVLLLFFVLLAKSVSAETFVPYTPNSLQKGDWLKIESVLYYPYIAPGIKEELPWRAENIRRVTFQATVTDINADALTIDFTLDNLYDCRNDSYFDSRYQQDFAFKDSTGYIRMKDGSPVSISRQRRNYVMEILKQL